jgi:hypothetical protein
VCGAVRRSLFAVAGLIALGLSACAAQGPILAAAENTPGEWQITRKIDPVSGAAYSTAVLETSRISNAAFALAGSALMQPVCFKGEPLVHFTFGFQLGANATSTIAYRFDGKPGHNITPHFLRGNTMFVIDRKSEVEAFVKELAVSDVLILQISSLTKGQTTAEFHVSGAKAAIDAALASCRVKA